MSPGFRSSARPSALLARPDLRRYLEGYVRRRVRPDDADDTVQAVLCAALEAPRAPSDEEELRRWITGIARRKIAATWARAAREPAIDAGEIEAGAPPLEARALVAWAEREAAAHGADAARTLAWMAREGEGEKLEAIAADENEPAPRVRQRVSRLRRWLRARWTAEIAAAIGAAIAIAIVAWLLFAHRAPPPPRVAPAPLVTPDPAPALSAPRDPIVAPPPPPPAPTSSSRRLAPAPTSTSVPRPPPSKRSPRSTTPTGSSL